MGVKTIPATEEEIYFTCDICGQEVKLKEEQDLPEGWNELAVSIYSNVRDEYNDRKEHWCGKCVDRARIFLRS